MLIFLLIVVNLLPHLLLDPSSFVFNLCSQSCIGLGFNQPASNMSSQSQEPNIQSLLQVLRENHENIFAQKLQDFEAFQDQLFAKVMESVGSSIKSVVSSLAERQDALESRTFSRIDSISSKMFSLSQSLQMENISHLSKPSTPCSTNPDILPSQNKVLNKMQLSPSSRSFPSFSPSFQSSPPIPIPVNTTGT